MFLELIEKIFGVLTSNTKADVSSSIISRSKKVKNATSPIEFKSKNVVMPNDKKEKEIQALYSEIRELQAKNREIASQKRLLTL